MLGHRQLSFEDYVEILRRRWWVILIPALIGCGGTYLVSLQLPNRYTSHTLVLVEQQKVPDNYVKSVVTGDIAERLGTMQEQILSRTRLQPIIEKFDLFQSDKGKVPMEDLVDSLRGSISVRPIQSLVSTREGELPGFSISFTAHDPRMAQQVCAEITSMFIAENLRLREQSAEGTTDFLKNQLEDAKRNLDAQDAKLAEFKRKNLGSLPGNEQTDLNMLASLTSQLDAVTSQLNRAQQDKAYMETLLGQQLAAWEQARASSGGGEAHTDTLERQLANLQEQLISLESHYTPDYPDVVKMKADIAALKKQIEDNAAHAKDKPTPRPETPGLSEPPEIQRLRFAIHQNEALIREKTREQARMKDQLNIFQSRVSMSPAVEQQYKEVTRDYQTALQFYNDLLAKKSQSEMATSLEQRQEGEQFRIMDPADLPLRPSFPNRPLFAEGGLGLGLALGIGITLLLEFRDKSLRSQHDVEQFLNLAVLATVPEIGKSLRRIKPRPKPGKKSETELGRTVRV